MREETFQSFAEVRALLADLFQVNPGIYWADFLANSALAWGTFWLGLRAPLLFPKLAWLVVSGLAFHRGGLFVHEIFHQGRAKLGAFPAVWNVLCGSALFVPDSSYLSHAGHHSASTYGTAEDPEYVPLVYASPFMLIAPIVLVAVVPVAAVLRYLLIGPASLLVGGRLREVVLRHYSSLKLNPRFEWRTLTDEDRLAARRGDITVFAWWAAFLTAAHLTWGVPKVLAHWIVMDYVAALTNHYRLHVQHRYLNASGVRLSYDDQLLDTVVIAGFSPAADIICPLGLRYHTLHHMFPSLPYHALRVGHRRLMAKLSPEHPYRKTVVNGALASVWLFCRTVVERRAARAA